MFETPVIRHEEYEEKRYNAPQILHKFGQTRQVKESTAAGRVRTISGKPGERTIAMTADSKAAISVTIPNNGGCRQIQV